MCRISEEWSYDTSIMSCLSRPRIAIDVEVSA